MIGQTFGHFRILEKLGAGGMGVVYRARDEQLQRDVALKVLPAGLLADENARKRFRQEALALSKLNHANIATVHAFGNQDGVDFLVMELVEGETLAARIAGRALSEKEVAACGAQIANALEEAHEHGVVHRDLKPSNIVITPKGQVKVLDFGLARLLRSPGESGVTASLTATPAAAGTLPYMAPEQLQGEEADARSDIYSLGAVFYEMATGQRAFREELSTRLIDAILHRPPVAPRARNERVSPELERIILKCLEKEPERRYQSAKEVGVDLRRLTEPSSVSPTPQLAASPAQPRHAPFLVGTAAVAGILLVALGVGLNIGGMRERLLGRGGSQRIESLAVLPLENLSRDPAQDYFADGMTEELTTDLAQIGALRVISHTSVMQYKGAHRPTMPEIGRQLNVDALVEGSVLRAGQRVRITAQLIRAATDEHLWAKSYEGDLGNVLSLQSNVARGIAEEIKATLSPRDQARLASNRKIDPEAHDAYLRGLYQMNKRTDDGLAKSSVYFQRALEMDPGYALAYSALANSYALRSSFLYMALSPNEAMPRSKAAARSALGLDNSLAEGLTALAYVEMAYDWDWMKSQEDFNRAIELNPNYAWAHHWYAIQLGATGRHEESISEVRRAHELDPLAPIGSTNVGWMLYFAHKYDDAIQQFHAVLEADPDFYVAHWELGIAYQQKGMYEEARSELERARRLSPNNPVLLASLGEAYAASGRRAEARQILDELTRPSQQRFVSPYVIAELYVALGARDRALQWLQTAYEQRDGWLIFLKVDPKLRAIQSDPRFEDLMRRMKFPP